jgi:hypothetical protein
MKNWIKKYSKIGILGIIISVLLVSQVACTSAKTTDSVQSQIDSINIKINTMQSNIATLQNSLKDITGGAKQSDVDSLKSQINGISNQLTTLSNTVKNIENPDLSGYAKTGDLLSIKESINTINTNITDLKTKIDNSSISTTSTSIDIAKIIAEIQPDILGNKYFSFKTIPNSGTTNLSYNIPYKITNNTKNTVTSIQLAMILQLKDSTGVAYDILSDNISVNITASDFTTTSWTRQPNESYQQQGYLIFIANTNNFFGGTLNFPVGSQSYSAIVNINYGTNSATTNKTITVLPTIKIY